MVNGRPRKTHDAQVPHVKLLRDTPIVFFNVGFLPRQYMYRCPNSLARQLFFSRSLPFWHQAAGGLGERDRLKVCSGSIHPTSIANVTSAAFCCVMVTDVSDCSAVVPLSYSSSASKTGPTGKNDGYADFLRITLGLCVNKREIMEILPFMM